MVRLMLVLAPVMCILSGIGISSILTNYIKVKYTHVTQTLGRVPRSGTPKNSGGTPEYLSEQK